MQADNIACLVQLLCRMHGLDISGQHSLVRTIGVIGINLHAESLGDASHVSTHIAKGVDTEFLAFQFSAACAVVQVAYGINHQPESQFGYGVAVLTGSVHRYDLVCRGGSQVDVVIAGTGTHNDLQLLGCVQHLAVHNIRADDQCVSIGHCVQQLLFVCIFLQQGEFVTSLLNHLAYAVNGNLGERFFCCY